jgi:hypothetical protein
MFLPFLKKIKNSSSRLKNLEFNGVFAPFFYLKVALAEILRQIEENQTANVLT